MKFRSLALLLAALAVVLFSFSSTSPAISFTALRGLLTTAQPQAGPYQQFIPAIHGGSQPAAADEWTQHAHDAQHTSYTALAVATPWHWKWSWNGPNAQGAVSAGKFRLPRNVQPVTGGGRVYVAAGTQGGYALNIGSGAQVWNRNPGGEINSTPAYDPQNDALFVVSSNGRLYRLNALTGQTTAEYDGLATSSLPLPPTLQADRVYFSMGSRIFALFKNNLALAWSYQAGSPVHTPPAVSAASGLVLAFSEDLYVHAVHSGSGTRAWRVKPTTLSAGDPGDNAANAEVKYGWPVIAEAHGLVLVKLRLNWQTLWTWNPWPATNAQMRANLASRPDQQALYALRLADGGQAFATNLGHGGFGDGGRMDMGPQPVVKRYADGSEVAYVVMRGSNCIQAPCDGRYDSHLGEMLLDSTSIAGFQAGDVRFMQNSFFPTDEQPSLSMAGGDLFGGHWMFGIAHQVLDRGPARGAASGSPILTSNLPHIITSTASCAFSASHYCAQNMLQDGDPRSIPAGFYVYYNQGQVYNQYWRGYAAWVVSAGQVYFLSNDGALIALENGPSVPDSRTAETPPPAPPSPPVLAAPIPYTLAREFAGTQAQVEGPIRFMFNNGKTLLLGFENPHAGAFKALIPVEYLQNFSENLQLLFRPSQRIRVRGLIEWYQGDPVILLRGPEQIEVLAE